MKCECGETIHSQWSDIAADAGANGLSCPACGDTIPFDETSDKELMREAYLAGYRLGKDVENVSGISERTATERFEQWYGVNFKQ